MPPEEPQFEFELHLSHLPAVWDPSLAKFPKLPSPQLPRLVTAPNRTPSRSGLGIKKRPYSARHILGGLILYSHYYYYHPPLWFCFHRDRSGPRQGSIDVCSFLPSLRKGKANCAGYTVSHCHNGSAKYVILPALSLRGKEQSSGHALSQGFGSRALPSIGYRGRCMWRGVCDRQRTVGAQRTHGEKEQACNDKNRASH